jgi:hypothetical protein
MRYRNVDSKDIKGPSKDGKDISRDTILTRGAVTAYKPIVHSTLSIVALKI